MSIHLILKPTILVRVLNFSASCSSVVVITLKKYHGKVGEHKVSRDCPSLPLTMMSDRIGYYGRLRRLSLFCKSIYLERSSERSSSQKVSCFHVSWEDCCLGYLELSSIFLIRCNCVICFCSKVLILLINIRITSVSSHAHIGRKETATCYTIVDGVL